MFRTKRGQISVEYLIVIGFVVFIVISILGVAFFYASGIRDRIKTNQLENFANKIISSAESVYFAGEPSKVTITAYLPAGVQAIEIVYDSGSEEYLIIFDIETGSGISKIAYTSDVPLETGSSIISISEGVKRLQITAVENEVSIVEG